MPTDSLNKKKDKPTKKSAENNKALREGQISFAHMIPNIVTLLALASGLTAIRYGIDERWQAAMVLILVAGIFDVLDGAIARLLKATSDFGAELDSLSDFVSFGVAPALILYLWVMQDAVALGWLSCLVFAMACGLRLARFNVRRNGKPLWQAEKYYFEGVPSPAGAVLALLPFFMSFELGAQAMKFSPVSIAFWLLGVAALMILRIPTFSVKGLRLPGRFMMPVLGGVVFLIASFITEPWKTLGTVCVIYLISLPISFWRVKRTTAKRLHRKRSS
jgi:CDP-diacylglycerol--serine O-phosphatidyltransferase